MTAQSMQMPSPLFVWATQVLYTWNWANGAYLDERIRDNPLARQRAWVIAKAISVMAVQLVVWSAAIVALVAYPFYLVRIGRGDAWLSASAYIGATLIVYCVCELWIYTRRYAGVFTTAGHRRFIQMWPLWVRYVLPVIREGNDPHMSVARLVILGGALFWLQYTAQDWDLQKLTRMEQTCGVKDVSVAYAHERFKLRTRIHCPDGREFTVTDGYMSALTWNDRSDLQCLTYEGGLLSCSRK